MVSLTIDGKQISVEEGSTVLDAARQAGISIPAFCHHESLKPYGSCRMCTVEVKHRGRTRLLTSCTLPASEGMEVNTSSQRVARTRRMLVELMLARCPESKAIQDMAAELGVKKSRFRPPTEKDNSTIVGENGCILCGKCVRLCNDVLKVGALGFEGRGGSRRVTTPFGEPSEVCHTCGACSFVCPTGAIEHKRIHTREPEKIPFKFEENLTGRKPSYIQFPQAVPLVPVIDKENCMHFKTRGCKVCEDNCEANAIDLEQEDTTVELDVGAIILAPGYDPFDAELKGEFSYGTAANVVTSLQYERLLNASGPTQGKVLRPSDETEPRRIAWIQCVGSRDETCGNEYCSSVCCMYATKEAVMTREHIEGVETTIFFNDIRAFGKGFERYYKSAQDQFGVRYVKSIVSSVKELQQTKNLRLKYALANGEIREEEFDLVVLSVGMVPSKGMRDLATMLEVEVDQHGFCKTDTFHPEITSRAGVFACGTFEGPMDIPESVMTASSTAALAAELLAPERGTLTTTKEYPPERDVSGEEPRVGVFVCRCGTNIARVVEVQSVVEYAKTLDHVVHAEENMFTCATESQKRIRDAIREKNLNRVVVSACTPRTHEPLFQDTLREAGTNKYLFEMANIRDQCSWVHYDDVEEANAKAKDLVRMAVARAVTLEPLEEHALEIVHKGLVIGGGLSGLTAALSLAGQGFETYLIEKSDKLGGNLQKVRTVLEGEDIQGQLDDLLRHVEAEPLIQVFTNAEVTDFSGHVGNYKTVISVDGQEQALEHGIVIVATGAVEHRPEEFLYGQDDRVLTQLDLEEMLRIEPGRVEQMKSVVMVQCVGSREDDHQYCSRICCAEAIKNALEIKRTSPDTAVYVLHRDVRTYGHLESFYKAAREAGVVFVRFEGDAKPEVAPAEGHILVQVHDEILGARLRLEADLVVLSSAVRPDPNNEDLSQTLKVSLDADGFFLEAHLKLRPLDFVNEGMFLCGMAHSPKFINESISQARGAAARAATILSKDKLYVSGITAKVEAEYCAACLTCVRVCPFGVPEINEEGVAVIDTASCHGCGSCASACPRKAILLGHYKDEQIVAKINALV